MKAADFNYVKPTTLSEAIGILSQNEGAVPLAGGQSLLATLNMRLSSPETLVDIGALDELRGIRVEKDAVRIGALTRHVDLLNSPLIAQHLPLLTQALHHVAHPAIRNRGTIGGSVSYADPAAEMPACMLALGAKITMVGANGARVVPAEQFFKGLFETDLRPGELISEFHVPMLTGNQSWAFDELSRRRGDFALAGLVAICEIAADQVQAARLVYFGCSEYPMLAAKTASTLVGRSLPLSDGTWLSDSIAADLSPTDTTGLRADTKIKLATTLTRRMLSGFAQDAAHAISRT